MGLKNSLFISLICWLCSFFAGLYKNSFISRVIDSVKIRRRNLLFLILLQE